MTRTNLYAASLAILVNCLTVPAVASETAKAVLVDPEGKEVGTVTLKAVPTGVLLDADFTALPEGAHAFHVHGIGECEPPSFKSAGIHFNPFGKKHGLENPEGPHAGDMPNIHVPENGKLRIEVLNQMITLPILFDGEGTAIVIHRDPDDYVTDPAGEAGPRIACGVITK